MDAVNDLAQVTRLRFDLAFRSRIDALGIALEERDRARPGICIAKPAGRLEFKLNTQFLRLSALETDFDILFSGTRVASDIVRWDATLPNGPVKIKTKVGDATINTLEGTIFTKVSAIAPPRSDTSCTGDPVGMVASWDTFDEMGYLHAEADASLGTAKLDVTSLGIVGLAGDPEHFAVAIKQYAHSECVAAAVEGQPASFHAFVSGVPATAPLSYAWSIDGNAAPIGSTTSATLKARMPSPPEAVTVRVTVTVTQAASTSELSASLGVSLVTGAVARSMTHFCQLFMQAPIHPFVRPLWDPLRDLVVRPVTLDEAKALLAFAQGLGKLGTKLVADRSRPSAKARKRT
jgi:hypothetical protein